MDKLSFLDRYIRKCEEILENQDGEAAKELEYDMIGIFKPDIPDISNTINSFRFGGEVAEYLCDIRRLKGKLENYRANLELEESRAKRELELARLKQPTMTQTTNISVTVTIEQTIKRIDEVPDASLSEADKATLKDYLYSLEGIKAAKDKPKFWDKAKEVLKFLADKGADAAIAALPLIIQSLQVL